MLPTLLGRWQTRILLFLCVGLPISALYAAWLGSLAPTGRFVPPWIRSLNGIIYDVRPMQIICLLLIVGVVLDIVYSGLQRLRWDRDWPFAFQFVCLIFEFLVVLGLIQLDILPFMPARWIGTGDYTYLFVHFGLVFGVSFASLLGFIQIFMIRWRYKGGEWGKL
ncbi:hypothetical protein IVB14_04750 [Bradyrhizobium sp. 180]|uniref:hypothetical protein n=1 Tax=Bradyrhizobium sp. 180 TaxID=2782650 RepID=UPI001FFA662E|nr:hypothetical protein [Bradyrhizobium sp. 180]MCK1489747.1 hypothetical protein [Bradyrhizobium sp. 180]